MRKLLIASLALNAVVLLAVAWFGFGPGRTALLGGFLAGHQTRLVSAFEALPIAPDDVVFLGDSITEGGPWEELFPDIRVRNRGIGGDTTGGLLRRLNQVTEGTPAKLFLMIGTNDLFRGDSEAEIVARIEQILERVKEESPDTELYVQSVLPRAAGYRESVEGLNARLAEIAVEMGTGWVDLYPAFLDSETGAIRSELSNDELHLLGPGYILWRDQIEALVRAGAAPTLGLPAEEAVELTPSDPPAGEGF
jgi:lysophospholipase L1-like esterase